MFLLKMLFRKLCFCLTDSRGFAAIGGDGAPSGQPEPEPAPEPSNGNPEGGEPAPEPPTDHLEFEGGVKISREAFDKHAKELYKDRFEAYDNREKWQAENTRRAQELAQDKRDAEEFRRMKAEQTRNPSQAQNPYEKAKQEYIQDHKKDFPDMDERFLAKQFDWQMKLAGQRAEEFVSPIQNQQAEAYEAKFLAEHPKVQKGTPQYEKIARLMGAGVEAEEAYHVAFPEDRIETEIKKRNEEAARKLKQSRTQSTPAQTGKLKGREVFEAAWSKHGDK